MPALIFLAFAAVMLSFGATVSGGQGDRRQALQADTAALSLLNYRSALRPFLSASPQFEGVVAAEQLRWPTGATATTRWRHVVHQGTVYVYEAQPAAQAGLLDSLVEKFPDARVVGRNQQCRFVSAGGRVSGSLPAALCGAGASAQSIPDGAIVVIGL